ncbi:MAG: mannose-6-phosphate isomerase, class I [Salinispira sp.]
MIYKIQPAAMYYSWGSKKRIERIFGIQNPGNDPVAELWYGTHERGPSILIPKTTGARDLRQLLHTHQLPFLFKILSADGSLSIQAHPSKGQAELGFERENRQGIDIDAPERNYRDRNHKPECLVAMEDFWALSGFRKPGIIAEHFRTIAGTSPPPILEKLLTILDGGAFPEDSSSGNSSGERTINGAFRSQSDTILRTFYSSLMRSKKTDQSLLMETALSEIASRGLGENAARGGNGADGEMQWYWLRELHRQFPGDPGCLAPLYLNLLNLKRGEALFMKAGILHAYLQGTGLEIMANSDNVLRGGCTQKHVDVPELLSVIHFHADDPTRPLKSAEGWYESFAPEFRIAIMDVPADSFLNLRAAEKLGEDMGIILMLNGEAALWTSREELLLKTGEAAFVACSDADDAELSVRTGSCEASFALASVNVFGEWR